jgi:hypothetical protein
VDRTPAQTSDTEPLVKFIGVEKSYDGHALAAETLRSMLRKANS